MLNRTINSLPHSAQGLGPFDPSREKTFFNIPSGAIDIAYQTAIMFAATYSFEENLRARFSLLPLAFTLLGKITRAWRGLDDRRISFTTFMHIIQEVSLPTAFVSLLLFAPIGEYLLPLSCILSCAKMYYEFFFANVLTRLPVTAYTPEQINVDRASSYIGKSQLHHEKRAMRACVHTLLAMLLTSSEQNPSLALMSVFTHVFESTYDALLLSSQEAYPVQERPGSINEETPLIIALGTVATLVNTAILMWNSKPVESFHPHRQHAAHANVG